MSYILQTKKGIMNNDLQSPVIDIYEIWINLSVLHRFTARITELMKVLKELHSGKYERTMVTQREKGTQDFLLQQRIVLFSGNWSYTAKQLNAYLLYFVLAESDITEKFSLVPGSGEIIHQDNVIK